MGWNTREKAEEKRQKVIVLIAKYGNTLTWEQAQDAVLIDTLQLAAWSGLKRSGLSPMEALKKLKGIQ